MTPASFYTGTFAPFPPLDDYNEKKTLYTAHLQAAQIDPVWKNLSSKYSPITAKIVVKQDQNHSTILGTGQWIDQNSFLTASHVLKFDKGPLFIVLENGTEIPIYKSSGSIDMAKDLAIFQIKYPVSRSDFPKVSDFKNHSFQVAMMHYGKQEHDQKLSVGFSSSAASFQYAPLFDIDGGPGSSGAAIYNTSGDIIALHRARMESFDDLRTSVYLDKNILSILKTNRDDKPQAHVCEIEEHGLFETKEEKRVEKSNRFSKDQIDKALSFAWTILHNKAEDFFTKIWGPVGTLYYAKHLDVALDSLRLDIQKPSPTHINLQIQYLDQTLATVLVSRDLEHVQDKQHIHSLVKYIVGQFIDCLHSVQDHNKIIGKRIENKLTNTKTNKN